MDDLTLAHYGVKGMKWGVRRDKKRIQRSLNRLDQQWANETAKTMNNKVKAERYLKKGNREKADKYGKATIASMKKAKAIESEQWKLIGEAAQKKYEVYQTSKKRSGERGRSFVQTALVGALGNTAITSSRIKQYSDFNGDYPWSMSANKFEVK